MTKAKHQKTTKGKGKVFLIIALCVLVLVLLPLSLLFLKGNSHLAKNDSDKTLIDKQESSVTNLSSNEITQYLGNGYSFWFPKSWKTTTGEMVANRGTSVLLQPNGDSSLPYVNIQIADAKKVSRERLSTGLSLFNARQSYATVAGIQALKYTQVLASNKETFHVTAYIFQKDNTIYLLKLGYKKQSVDVSLEDTFTQIVDSFTLE